EAHRVLRPAARFAASVPLNGGKQRPWVLLDEVVDRWLPPAPVAMDQAATRTTVADPDVFRDQILAAGFAEAAVEVIEERVHWQSAEQLVELCMSWWDLASRVEALPAERRQAFVDDAIATVRREHPGAIETVGRNHVAYVSRLAHASEPRIEVHAWVNTFFSGQGSRVYAQHGDEWGNRTADGQTGGYLDPGVPEVQIYMHRVFMDLAQSYDIDGIHLDFVRHPGADWGYSPSSVGPYMAATGATSAPDPGDPQWQAWRRARVTAFVR